MTDFNTEELERENQTPNIVFVFADQLRSHALSCYGNAQVNTPNMDRLASEGVRFTNAISTHPVCGPFRAMLMTGNFPIKNGMLLTDHFLRNPDPCFAEVCKSAGYKTAYIGKWHLDGYGRERYIPRERRLGFDYWKALECTHKYFDSKYYSQNEKKPRVWPEYDAISQTHDACEYINGKSEDDPFCLFLSWGPPHGPYEAPDEYLKRFPPDKIKLRENVEDFETGEKLMSESDTVLCEEFQNMRESYLEAINDHENKYIRRMYSGYYAAMEVLDDCLGEIMRVLDESGKLENTIIVFTSDHGDNLGSHRQKAKQMPFEESISIPLIIRYPARIQKGIVSESLIRPVDLMPTVLSLAGISCPQVDGCKIKFMSGASDGAELDAVLIQKSIALGTNWITNGNGPWVGVRTKRHTYARDANSNNPWFLYDNQKDPFQLDNLVGKSEYNNLVNEFDNLTTQLLQEAGEPGDPNEYANLIQEERDARGMENIWHRLFPARV